MRVVVPVRRAALLAALAGFAAACGARDLPRPPIGPNDAAGYVEVPYPPPPARPEIVPPQPSLEAVWIDGQWAWHGTRWRWSPGGWVAPPQSGTYFAPWMTARRADGVLLFTEARWRNPAGQDVAPPAMLAQARTSLTPTSSEEAPNDHPDQTAPKREEPDAGPEEKGPLP
jgi:hypothetical protein